MLYRYILYILYVYIINFACRSAGPPLPDSATPRESPQIQGGVLRPISINLITVFCYLIMTFISGVAPLPCTVY